MGIGRRFARHDIARGGHWPDAISLRPVWALFAVLLLSACAHGPHAPRAPESGAPESGAQALATEHSSTRNAAGGAAAREAGVTQPDVLWPDGQPYGGKGETLALFPPLAAADRLRLGGEHRPGAIDTYVLYGVGDGRAAQENRPWRHGELELLRLIDTYVINLEESGRQGGGEFAKGKDGAAAPARHEFLVPVYAGLDSLPLAERSAPDLADAARLALATRLEARGHGGVAHRLRSAPGPFLVSRATPALLPDRVHPRLLLADLSALGAEYLYAVVDAYDRPVAGGADAALVALHGRLAELEAAPGPARSGPQWLYLLDTSTAGDGMADGARHGG